MLHKLVVVLKILTTAFTNLKCVVYINHIFTNTGLLEVRMVTS